MRDKILGAILGVIGTILTTIFVGWWQAPKTPITASINWVSIETNIRPDYTYDADLVNAAPVLERVLGVSGMPAIITKLKYARASIVSVDIENNGKERSKGIELFPSGALVAVIGKARSSTLVSDSDKLNHLTLAPMLPKEKVSVLLLVTGGFYRAPDMKVLHDGRNIDLRLQQYPEDAALLGVVPFLASFSPLSDIFVISILLMMALVIAGASVTAYTQSDTTRWVNSVTKADAERFAKLVDQVRRDRPELLMAVPAPAVAVPVAAPVPSSTPSPGSQDAKPPLNPG